MDELEPSPDGVYDYEEEMEKFWIHQAATEYEYRARSAEEKKDQAWWKIVNGWVLDRHLGAGISLFMYGEGGWSWL